MATGKLKVVEYTYRFLELFEGMGEQLFSLAEEEVRVRWFHSSELWENTSVHDSVSTKT